ncbi:MAG: anthranilate phosphoribosyltransferase [Candidatus Hydrogenedentes bacterium]|nr:anthranilate phosphoribosyltransferase [Candidatus Hydrogenedentota bacterium]
MIHDALSLVLERRDLSREQASRAMTAIMSGEATAAQIAALLAALRMKGETIDEIAGFAMAMRTFATPVHTSRRPLVDTCGTGGDCAGTFNVSTTAAFVVAGAGVAVAKHGNRSASSRCGSADVLEKLGVRIDMSAAEVGQCIDEIGIGFLFARSFHQAMRHVAPVRSELGFRTVFNLLGPLTNPASACGQVVGVPDRKLVEPIAYVLSSLGARRAFVVSGADGLDELTLAASTCVAEARGGSVQTYELTPEDVGLPRAPREALLGGDAEANAHILLDVLKGVRGPHRDIVLFNAAAGILAGSDTEADWRGAVDAANQSIDSGAAFEKLEALIRYGSIAGANA